MRRPIQPVRCSTINTAAVGNIFRHKNARRGATPIRSLGCSRPVRYRRGADCGYQSSSLARSETALERLPVPSRVSAPKYHCRPALLAAPLPTASMATGGGIILCARRYVDPAEATDIIRRTIRSDGPSIRRAHKDH